MNKNEKTKMPDNHSPQNQYGSVRVPDVLPDLLLDLVREVCY